MIMVRGVSVGAEELDVDAYLRAIGLPQAQRWEQTVASLERLCRAHLDTFAFADVTTALGRVPKLDLATLERRMVNDHRGGYCHEHVTLFAAALDALGFACAVHLGRVGESFSRARPATHLTTLVQPLDDGCWWMADVGFGLSARGPIPVPQSSGPGEPVRYGAWEHRVDRDNDGRLTLLERDRRDTWRTLHTSNSHEAAAHEILAANRWVALNPDSPFSGRLVALRSGDERRERLIGNRFEVITEGEVPEIQQLSPAKALETLAQRFKVEVDDDENTALLNLLTSLRH